MNQAAGAPNDALLDGAGHCSACGAAAIEVLYEQSSIPVTSNRLFRSQEDALACERGEMRLGCCRSCGLVANLAFDGSAVQEDYESSQAVSPHFLAYARDLSRAWIRRHGLAGATVLEIGCGRGEFLAAFCEESGGRGIGVDPILAKAPPAVAADAPVEWVPEAYRAAHLPPEARAILCRHTLEHISRPAVFLDEVRESIGERDVALLIEVPDVMPVLRELAFWDVYYEHCVYFSPGSLARVLERSGFDLVHLEHTYGGQYLVAEARARHGPPAADALPAEDDRDAVRDALVSFGEEQARRTEVLRCTFDASAASGERVVFWGAGSKATAYLTTLDLGERVQAVVDINPRKQGSYIPGAGHPVVAPEDLLALQPDIVVMMNPVYRAEIEAMLAHLDVPARVLDPGAL